jgi:hypothetical protein
MQDHNDPPDETVDEQDRRHGDRRHAERRMTLTLGGRRLQEDRRRRDRRLRLAGAGLLAAMAFAAGAHEVAARVKAGTLSLPGLTDEPSASVDVATDFHLPAWDREALEPYIQEAATLHGLSPSLIRAVIETESRFDPLAVSRVGAQGLMQLMPQTSRRVGIENPFDPRENILGGTKYLSSLLERFDGNTARALAAYNAGPTVVARHRGLPPYRETQGYVRKIQKLVDNTDAEFSLPVAPRRAALQSRASSRKASAGSASSRRRPALRKASSIRSPVAKRTSVRASAARGSASRS